MPSLPHALKNRLVSRFGDRFSQVPAILDQHGRDESWHPTSPPDAVVFAETTEDVQVIMTACAEHAVPVIPFGAGSSVAAGAGATASASAG